MNETGSVFLATLLIAMGGAGFYFYKNYSENDIDKDDVSDNNSVEKYNINDDDEQYDNENDFNYDYEYDEPIKIKKKLNQSSNKSKKNYKKNLSKTKRRY
jgi:hypothetical protein